MDPDANFECVDCGGQFRWHDGEGMCADCGGRLRDHYGRLVPVREEPGAGEVFDDEDPDDGDDVDADATPRLSDVDLVSVGVEDAGDSAPADDLPAEGQTHALGRGRWRGGKWLLAVLLAMLLAANGTTAWLLIEERGRVDELEEDVASVRDDSGKALAALTVAAGSDLGELERKLSDLEDAVFGFGSATSQIGSLSDDVNQLARRLDTLRQCINRLVADLEFGSSFLSRCL